MSFKHLSIKSIEITNFKRFYGTHTLNLLSKPEQKQPIILIGGDNGRGKTTILESVYYTLYEDDDLPGIQTRPTYLRAVGERLNRTALDEGRQDYGVALELRVIGIGPARDIRIERQWEVDIKDRRVNNSKLNLFENGRPIDWVDDSPSAYQEFLRGLIPSRTAPFFFFDGERIQHFAEDEHHEQRMVDAIEDLLHISVYKTLRDDLKRFVIEHLEKAEIKSQPDDYHDLQQDKERIESALEEKNEKVLDIGRDLSELERERKQTEDELSRISSPHASQRDELIEERTRLRRELEEVRSNILTEFESLPILLAGQLRIQLADSLNSAQGQIVPPEQLDRLIDQLSEVKQELFFNLPDNERKLLAISEQLLVYFSDRFDKIIDETFNLKATHTRETLHDLNRGELNRILERIRDVDIHRSRLRDFIDSRERLDNDLRDVDIKLQSTSTDPLVLELIQKHRQLNEKAGALKEEEMIIRAEIQRLKADLASLSRGIQDRLTRRSASSQARKTVRMAQSARRVLDEFIKRLAPKKLELLKHYMQEMYGRLMKAEDPVKTIDIDQETWQVILRDEKGRRLEKRVFSQGMKEIYALSLLWALSRASGNELPIMIDTPLGRLDSYNRGSLCRNYFPSAGHQVIILSTDKEIDKEWFDLIRNSVARQYRLDFDSSQKSVVARPGYFF